MGTCLWFVEPKDDVTNEFIAKLLPEERFHREIHCKDGKKRPGWECGFDFVTMLGRVKNIQLKYGVFRKLLPGGAIGPFNPRLFSKKRKLAKKICAELAKKYSSRASDRS